MTEKLKVVIVGAASPQWGFTLCRDIVVALSSDQICSRFTPVLVLEDIDAHNLDKQKRLALKVAELTGNRVDVASTTDQKHAVEGAAFVVTSLAQGTLEAMQHDLEIPEEYGIFQPVGDSISIGGALRAARNIPALVGIARDMERLADPDAWLLNLSNPMSMLCRAVTKATRVRTVGLCHELYGGIYWLSTLLGFPYSEWRERVRVSVLGINHCSWMQRLELDGEDGLARLREALAERGITGETRRLYDSDHPELRRDNVKINLFLRYGVLPYSGDRHNTEFFSEFVNRSTNKGADFGVLLTTAQSRLVDQRGQARQTVNELLNHSKVIDLKLSSEAVSRIITAKCLDQPFYDVGSIPYHGEPFPGVPDGAVLERMATYDSHGARPDPVEPLPPPVMEHLALHCRNIEAIVQASIEGNRGLFIDALQADPLLENMDRRKIPELVGRLLEVHREHLHPGFF
jgi:alpha-galactosidase